MFIVRSIRRYMRQYSCRNICQQLDGTLAYDLAILLLLCSVQHLCPLSVYAGDIAMLCAYGLCVFYADDTTASRLLTAVSGTPHPSGFALMFLWRFLFRGIHKSYTSFSHSALLTKAKIVKDEIALQIIDNPRAIAQLQFSLPEL